MERMQEHPQARRSRYINQLPEDCISHVFSLTTPRDTCIASAVSSGFRMAADSDATWERFLPPDYRSILSRAVEPVEYVSKKDLFFQLCGRHILIDGGKMSFGLERSKGTKCLMIAARELKIDWGEDDPYWKWIPLSNSRFSEGIMLLEVRWLVIRAKIKCGVLSARTAYAAYLIFRVEHGARWLGTTLQESSIIMDGMTVSKHWICLDPNDIKRSGPRHTWMPDTQKIGPDVKLPKDRDDGWKEIEMGRLYIPNGNDEELEVKLMEVRGGYWKSGLLLQGIEFRPLKDQSAFSVPTSSFDQDLIVEYEDVPNKFLSSEDIVDFCFMRNYKKKY